MWCWFPWGDFLQFYFIAVRTCNGRVTPLTGFHARNSTRLTVGAPPRSRSLELSQLASQKLYSH